MSKSNYTTLSDLHRAAHELNKSLSKAGYDVRIHIHSQKDPDTGRNKYMPYLTGVIKPANIPSPIQAFNTKNSFLQALQFATNLLDLKNELEQND